MASEDIKATEGFVDPAAVPKRRLYTGEEIPAIGMGTFGSDRYSPAEVAAAVAGGIRCGYRSFDCAAVYGNEAQIGEAFEEALGSGAVRREEIFVASKFWNDHHGRGDVLLSLAQTLKDLRLDYVDAYYIHWPIPNYHAPGAAGDARNPDSKPFSVEGFMGAWRQLERIHDLGLARHLGMSNMTIPKLERVLPLCRVKPALMEMEMHPSFQQEALFRYAVDHGIVPVAFCPIGSPNRPERDKAPGDVVDTELPEVAGIAAARGVHPAIVCVKWAIARGALPIPFSTHEKNYLANLRAAAEDPLTPEEMATLAQAERGCRLIKGQVFLWKGASGWQEIWDEPVA